MFLIVMMVGCAAPAYAQWEVTPYLGVNIGGDVEFRRGGPGASVGYLGSRLGFEFEFQRYQHFFKDSEISPRDPTAPPNCTPAVSMGTSCTDLNTRAWSFMGNVVAPLRSKRAKWRPYGIAGLGVIHPWIEGPGDQYPIAQNNTAVNAGGGVIYVLNNHVGLRGDLRYFRAFVDESKREGAYFKDYGWVRAAFGVTIAWTR
jgi:Outer membrane protein beta-barrel domain